MGSSTRPIRKLWVGALLAGLVLALAFFLSRGQPKATDSRPGDLSQQLQTQTGTGSGPGVDGGKSLFGSAFFRQGRPAGGDTLSPDKKRGASDILDPAAAGHAMVPGGRQPYSPAAMSFFRKMRQKYPNNRAIPRKRTPAEVQRHEAERMRMRALGVKISRKSASRAEVGVYFDYRSQVIRDHLQMLEYGRSAGRISGRAYRSLAGLGRKRMESYARARTRALKTAAR